MQGSIDFTGLLSGDIIGEGGTTVIANPSGSATDTLNKVQIDETIYSVEGGGGTEVIANPTGTATEDINTIEIDEVIYQIKGEKGDDGADGTDGTSAYASVSKSGNTATITCTDANGTTTAQISDGADGTDGTSAYASVSKYGNTATITCTDANGTTTAQISDGTNGTDGTDGTSAFASVSKSGNTATITCTDANGTTTAQISDGSGVPTGGSAGQVLVKDSATNYDTSWSTLDASDIPYDNTTSGMTATDVQDAVSELKSNLTDLTGFINGSSYITQTADRAVLNYTATQDCWINITVNATGIEIKIDNGTLPVATLSGSASALSSIMLPLKTGQTITSSSAIRIANVFPML